MSINPLDHLGLVRKFACRFLRRGMRVEELDEYQDGVSGLLVAAERFDAGRGVQFSTYACWYIKAAIQRGQMRMRPAGSKSPRAAKHGTQTTVFTDLAVLGESGDWYEPIRDLLARDDPAPDWVQAEADADLTRRAFVCLDERERTVVMLHIVEMWTLEAVGERFQISKERVRQILEVARRKMLAQLAGRAK